MPPRLSKSYLTLTDSILRSLTGAHQPNHKNQINHSSDKKSTSAHQHISTSVFTHPNPSLKKEGLSSVLRYLVISHVLLFDISFVKVLFDPCCKQVCKAIKMPPRLSKSYLTLTGGILRSLNGTHQQITLITKIK